MAAPSIVVCHAPPDTAFARDLALALETCRLRVWRDIHELRGGDRIVPEVRWAIEKARQVIVVIGLNTGDPAGLRREIELAQEVERGRMDAYRVIPLLLPGTDHSVLSRWFSPPPRTTPIQLTADGLGAALPTLLAILGEPLPSDAATDRSPSPLTELTLTFSPADSPNAGAWQLVACLHLHPESPMTVSASAILGSLPPPPDAAILRWYWHSYPCWPTDTVRKFARHADARLVDWGCALYQATLATPNLRELITAWRDVPDPRERRLVIQADATSPTTMTALDLPWELLHDGSDFLLQAKQPVQFLRRLAGGSDFFAPAPTPLRVLVVSPRPDTEPTGHPDHRRSALPLLEALDGLSALVEPTVLRSPTQAALEKQLNDAWAAGRLFTILHLDCYLREGPDHGDILLGFEAGHNVDTPLCRNADFIAAPVLAALLCTYRIRLVALVRPPDSSGSILMARLAKLLLAVGAAAVITVHPDAPHETLRRFWSAFYEESLRGARISQALFAGQRRLASDSYRAPGLGGIGIHLHDWSVCALYLGQSDPRLVLRPPLDLWRWLISAPLPFSLGLLPSPPPIGYIGRGRELLVMERLLENQAPLFLRGPGGIGKTAVAAALANWLAHCGRYRQIAYVSDGNARDPRALLETLGRQLLSTGKHWSVDQYPTWWQALDHVRQTLRPQPILIVLDQLERWPSEQDEVFDQFWKALLYEWPELQLLGLGRAGPPPFAQPWMEMALGPMEDTDAILLIGRTLAVAGEAPPTADSGSGFSQLCELVTLAGGHPGALLRVAHEIGVRGVSVTQTLLHSLRAGLRRQGDDPKWPLYLSLELVLRQLPPDDRERLAVLAFFKGGANRIALGHALTLDTLSIGAFCERLIALGLAEDQGYGHLRFDPALIHYLGSQLDLNSRAVWRERWRTGMEQLLAVLYPQSFKDSTRAHRLLRLELPNLLALLRDTPRHVDPERIARLANQLEQLLAGLGTSAALTEVVAARERASRALPDWSRIRFETERLRIERLRDEGALEDALWVARQLLRQCQDAGSDAYIGAAYDLAHAHFQLGKLLKLSSAVEPAAQEFAEARQKFQALADAGNTNAGRMAAVAEAETGDCLADLRRLNDAATAYEAALAHTGLNRVNPMVAANQLQLGLVRQRQGRYAEAAVLYDTARQTFETLGTSEGAAQAWRQLGLARKLNGEMEAALYACRQALYRYEQQHNHAAMAEILSEIGHLHQALNQLEAAAQAYQRMADLCAQLNDGHGEEAGRNKLASILILLRRHDEARKELYRASECNLPESPTARNWAIRRGLRDVGQAVENPGIADQARQQSIQKYLAYRRAGGENTNPGARLCTQISPAIQRGETTALTARLHQIGASPNVPPTGKLLITKLCAILAGSRDPTLATDPELHYQYAAEIQLLLEELRK
ncbi:MAG: TIR domain-containing protein [Candidatus Competibacteraceae bacterium]|nr:TIR domain-containing protein [Candidatus Competibacteraceae bacterium]